MCVDQFGPMLSKMSWSAVFIQEGVMHCYALGARHLSAKIKEYSLLNIVIKTPPGDKNQTFTSSMIFVKELEAGTSLISVQK